MHCLINCYEPTRPLPRSSAQPIPGPVGYLKAQRTRHERKESSIRNGTCKAPQAERPRILMSPQPRCDAAAQTVSGMGWKQALLGQGTAARPAFLS